MGFTACFAASCWWDATGIPEEYIGKIFDKFFQGPAAAAARGGMGLGLTFCRMVVDAHGGRIWAENCPAGGGVFKFTLPLAQ